MIVLRGILKADENGTWRWKGVWAFGSLPTTTPEELASSINEQGAATTETTTTMATTEGETQPTPSSSSAAATAATEISTAESTTKIATVATPRGRPKLQPVPTTRPFQYTWEKAVLPWQVLIPSANPMPEQGDGPSPSPSPPTATATAAAVTTSTTATITTGVLKVDTDVIMKDSVDQAKTEGTIKATTAQEEIQHGGGEAAAATTTVPPAVTTSTTTADESTDGLVIDKKENEDNNTLVKDTEKQPPSSLLPPADDNHSDPAKVVQPVDDSKELDDTKITFATISPGDPPFTDAAVSNPDKCPPGGAWKGFFENLPKRRDKPNIQIPESFRLFFNATPPKDARVTFADEPNDDDPKRNTKQQQQAQQQEGEGLLPPGHVHVRGCGTNEFGVFEILGSLDLETGILECQRIYVAVPEASPSYRTPRRPSVDTAHSGSAARGSKSLRSTSNLDSNDSNRPYLTRKRQLSWKRRSNYDSEGDDDASSSRKAGGSSAKKRVKLEDKPIIMPSLEAMQVMSPLANNMPVTTDVLIAANRPKKPPTSPRLQPLKKKAAASTNKAASTPSSASSSSSDSNRLKLPDAGDPRKARWRAAHFLYYQRHEPNTSEDGTTTSGKASAPSYVVYEGEMQDSLRWGFGICLYSNGMLYEGEWKRNKEHGKGTLMTSDRSRVIYEGEWERGRMHGKGVYYYGQADQINKKKDKKPTKPDGNETSRYEGEFKENMRHGFGTYYLPDGSVYSGMWREGLMSGRGVFTWPDNSVYDGEFRDGKRNGQGLLKTSDGFTYDGIWVHNAMEGRGSAIYPNGQRYDGLFSNGRREGRGTIRFTNGAVYEGRFRDDAMDGQGTMKISRAVVVPRSSEEQEDDDAKKDDFMIPVSFQSDMSHIHQKAGFTEGGE